MSGYRHGLVDVLEVLDDLEAMVHDATEDQDELDEFDLGFLEGLDYVKSDVLALMGVTKDAVEN